MNIFRNFFSIKISVVLLVLIWTGWNIPVWAYVSSSSNYRLQYDSLNSEGFFSSSSSYNLNDTMGEIGTGESVSSNFNLKAGFQRLDESTIAISSPVDITLSPDISGIIGGAADGSVDWNVTTDSAGGYSLNVKASISPALTSGSNNFADYVTSGSNPDYNWSVAASASEFGFSPKGSDIVDRYKDDGSGACANGSSQTPLKCWEGFSISDKTLCKTNTHNQPDGVTTTVHFRAESGYQKLQSPGIYTATIIATAISN